MIRGMIIGLSSVLATLLVPASMAAEARADTFFLKGGDLVVGTVIAADEVSVELKLGDETVIEIPGADLQPLSYYRALRSSRNSADGGDRMFLGDCCLQIGLTDLALSEYDEAAKLDARLATQVAAKRSLARSVLAYDLFRRGMKDFDAGRWMAARTTLQRFVAEFPEVEHLLLASRQTIRECDGAIFAVQEGARDADPAFQARLRSVERKMARIDGLLASARQTMRKALLGDQVSSKNRQTLLKVRDNAKRAFRAARELETEVKALPQPVVDEVAVLVVQCRDSLVDSHLKLAHLHLLASDYGGAKGYVAKILRIDPKNANARSLLRLIAARASEAKPPDEGRREVVRRYRKRAAILNGARSGSGRGSRATSTSPRSPAPKPAGRPGGPPRR